MRGIPNNPVECLDCKRHIAYPKDRLCNGCRSKRRPKKYPFTPEMDDYLRRVYADNSVNKHALTEAITAFAQRYRLPRHQVSHRAGRLGITFDTRRKWTPEEIQTLRELSGVKCVKAIAKRLRRADHFVSAMMDRLRISYAVTEGYNRREVCQMMGVSPTTVIQWVRSGLLKVNRETDRITEVSLSKFIRNHPDKYSLKRVDEAWFKGMIFPSFGLSYARTSSEPSQTVAMVE
jgi:hypothetical protein